MLNFKVSSIKTMPRSTQTEAMVKQHLASKVAETNGNALGTNAVTSAMIEQYRAEYQEFLKNLEKMDVNAMFNPAQPDTKVDEAKPYEVKAVVPEPVQEEAFEAFVKEDEKTSDLVNGISVGEEAGESLVIASTKKNRRKKSLTDDVETA